MNSRELMRAAMRGERTERIPTMPQIMFDVSIRVYASEDGRDWIDGIRRCIEDPAVVYDYVIRIVRQVGCDGLRLFTPVEPLKVRRVGDHLIVLDPETGHRTGRIDLHGGGGYVPDKPPPPVETLEEAKSRLDEILGALNDESLELLRRARERVPDLFVVSAPGGVTMNTYTELRGREQAMIDFYERPDFVSAVMDMQADAVIERAEKLLTAGIDALMIGDPAA